MKKYGYSSFCSAFVQVRKTMNIEREVKKMIECMYDLKRFIPVSERKYYFELDGIRLVIEDDKIVGWYRPDIEPIDTE